MTRPLPVLAIAAAVALAVLCPAPAAAQAKDIVDTAIAAGSFKSLVAAVQAAKDYQTSIIISSYTAERLKEHYDLAPLGAVVVKGKSRPVTIFEVRAGRASHDPGLVPRG